MLVLAARGACGAWPWRLERAVSDEKMWCEMAVRWDCRVHSIKRDLERNCNVIRFL